MTGAAAGVIISTEVVLTANDAAVMLVSADTSDMMKSVQAQARNSVESYG